MRLKDNRQRAHNAKIWLKLSMGLQVLVIPYSFYMLYMVEQMEVGMVNYADIQLLIGLTSIMGILGLGLFIGTAITFIQWFRRAYFNAHILFKGLTYSEGWAAGAWFVPIMWWFAPYQIASDFYKKTESKLNNEGIISGKSQFHLVGWWWGLWVASSILDNVNVRWGVSQSTEITFSVLSNLMGLAAGFFILKVIDNYSKMEDHLKELDTTGNPVNISDNPDLLD